MPKNYTVNDSQSYAQPEQPVRNAQAVTYSGGAYTPPNVTRRIYIGTAGDLKVDLVDVGESIVYSNHPAGYVEKAITKIHEVGTSALNIVVEW